MDNKWFSLEMESLDKKLSIIKQSIFLMKKNGFTLQDTDLYKLINMRDEILVEINKMHTIKQSILIKE